MTEFWFNVYRDGQVGHRYSDRGNCELASWMQAWRPVYRIHVRMKASQ